MILIQEGNTYNVNVPTYYIESDAELSQIPSTAPAGTLVQINETGNFHIVMKQLDGNFNPIKREA